MTDEAGAGPPHGPAHRGDLGSPEPGGYDEFDHSPAQPAASPEDAQAQLDEDAQTITGDPEVSETATDGTGETPVPEDEPSAVKGPPGDPALLAAERLEDLRRLQAEYINYKKRVDRERMRAREQGIASTLEALLPVLDDIHMAREHGDLTEGPFAAIADKLETVLGRLGIQRFGSAGEQFDPLHHEALMRVEAELDPAATSTTVVQVLQPGYRLGDRVVRAARVAVADPR